MSGPAGPLAAGSAETPPAPTDGRLPVELAWDAVVLAGGRARRLGGLDKPASVVGGRTLLDRVLTAVAAAQRVVVVGPARPLAAGAPVRWAREDPPGGGPLAALAAGMALVDAPLVAVLAADLPFLAAADLDRLRAAVLRPGPGGRSVDGALLVDPSGHPQLLAGVWRTRSLRTAVPATPAGMPMRALLTSCHTVGVPAGELSCLDCDSPAELAAARALAAGADGTGGASGPSGPGGIGVREPGGVGVPPGRMGR